MTATVRTLVVWCPDWPVVAAGLPLDEPVVVIRASRVVACSPAARDEGIKLHQRRREAQGRCPEVVVVEHDPSAEVRAFEPVVAALEALTPRIEVVHPGCCGFPTRGPSRYHGGDHALAERAAALAGRALAGRGVARVGVADGPFAARLAARTAAASRSSPAAGPSGPSHPAGGVAGAAGPSHLAGGASAWPVPSPAIRPTGEPPPVLGAGTVVEQPDLRQERETGRGRGRRVSRPRW